MPLSPGFRVIHDAAPLKLDYAGTATPDALMFPRHP